LRGPTIGDAENEPSAGSRRSNSRCLTKRPPRWPETATLNWKTRHSASPCDTPQRVCWPRTEWRWSALQHRSAMSAPGLRTRLICTSSRISGTPTWSASQMALIPWTHVTLLQWKPGRARLLVSAHIRIPIISAHPENLGLCAIPPVHIAMIAIPITLALAKRSGVVTRVLRWTSQLSPSGHKLAASSLSR
jgi:hypothetical protein